MSEIFQRFVKIQKIDDDQRVVTGVVYAPYELDTYADFMSPEDITQMAHKFMADVKLRLSIDTQHDETPNGSYPIESFIARAGDQDYPEGSWVLSVKVLRDDIWLQIKRGQINGYSFQAYVQKIPSIVEYEVQIDNFGVTEEVDNHRHMVWYEMDDDGRVARGRTSTVEGHSHEILGGTATEPAYGHAHRLFV